MRRNDPTDWSALRLNDRVAPGGRVLFVGINPGVRSAVTGHHFAGPSNRFWKLLFESGLVSEPIGHDDDDRLPEWGYGITNLIARPTPGINDLRPAEYAEGWEVLARKVRRYRPRILALVGVTVYRALLPRLKGVENAPAKERVALGLQQEVVHGARLFVLPNPSGRNANFTYAEMLSAFRSLKEELTHGAEHPPSGPAPRVLARPRRRKQVRTAGSDG
jgi:TDG/mug DNA glycosylase family protein